MRFFQITFQVVKCQPAARKLDNEEECSNIIINNDSDLGIDRIEIAKNLFIGVSERAKKAGLAYSMSVSDDCEETLPS